MTKKPKWYTQGREHIWYPYTQMKSMDDPLSVVSTSGCKIKLVDGREIIDGISSWWSACHGYSHPYIIDKMQEQLKKMPHIMFAGIAHEPAYELAARLCKMTGMDRVFFTDSGSTSIETAMKMAVQYWKNRGEKLRNKFICFRNGYHGDTMGCMSLCDPDNGMHKPLNNYMPMQFAVDIPVDEYGFEELDSLMADIGKTVAGVIIEPLIQGAGGMKFHSPDSLAEIYRIAKKHDLIFIADEVMTGFGRTGNMFACQEAAIKPDIMCLGKAITGGTMTLAATLASSEVFEQFLADEMNMALMSGPTFMANPLACSAANASLDLFENEPRLQQVEAIEKQLYEELAPCKKLPNVIDVRVKGAVGVVQIKTDWEEIFAMRKKFIKENVWLRPFGDVVYIMPAFTISKKELSVLTKAVLKILS
ncbi:adenosylmethionine--8-amino-7-oxononanoate transaminase [Rickettsiales bacterium]|nr:adenosylmethionine--8-amino-7-oxononanoate transaminase [Rickettsiales bacterium]